jgi:NAD(P)H-hydrate epimerase
VLVVCGPGNNGGDGYVLARAAREQRLAVRVQALTDPAKLRGDARKAYEDFVAAGGSVQIGGGIGNADVIVDAIFGTGLSRPVDAATADVIRAINDSRAHVLALDIPSGLHADTGEVLGAAIVAERTITFIGLKLGSYVGEGPDCTGTLHFEDLEVPASAASAVPWVAERIDEAVLARLLPHRRRTAHKGDNGSVLVIGGGIGMAGAARMTGEAALRAGAGLVTIATRAENVAAIVAGRPELMARGVTTGQLEALISRADVLAVGPGLGQDEWAQAMLNVALASDKTSVVDADALNLLARSPRRSTRWVLTPHPGEAGRLLGRQTAEVQRDRIGAAREIASRYGGTVVLKGAGTLVVTADEKPAICDHGNPGMASPGMGDVLTGVIAGIAAQISNKTSDLPGAARAGVLAHAMAGDLAARRGERGLLASDLFAYLPTCVNPAQQP